MSEISATIRFAAFGGLTMGDIDQLKSLASPFKEVRRGDILRHEGDPHPKMYLLLSGWTASSMIVPDGGRQLFNIHMPGDMLGMPSLAMANAPDTITALTTVTVSMIDTSAMGRLFKSNARIAALLFLISQEERVALMDRLVSIGRTSAINRVAAVVAGLYRKLMRADPAMPPSFEVPLTQSDLADMTGLTVVHVNRTIQRLRQDKILSWIGHSLTILNPEELNRLAAMPSRKLGKDPVWTGSEVPATSDRNRQKICV